MQAMDISRSGLDLEWRRLELIAQNIANADVAGPVGGRIYQQQSLLAASKGSFASFLDHSDQSGNGIALSDLKGVEARGVVFAAAQPRRVHEPSNPSADANGDVAYPAIDHAEQMTLMVKTARAYEANIVAMNAARQMYAKALDLGRRS